MFGKHCLPTCVNVVERTKWLIIEPVRMPRIVADNERYAYKHMVGILNNMLE